MNKAVEIAILGCGPAGLSTALALHQAGFSPRIFERFEAATAVGSGLILQPAGLMALEELGLATRIKELGQPIDRLFGRAEMGRVVLDVAYSDNATGDQGVAVHRSAIFGVLHQAAIDAGIPIELGVNVDRTTKLADSRVAILDSQGRSHGPFDLVVDALGSRSPLLPSGAGRLLPYGALWATLLWPNSGFDPRALEQRYRGAGRMVGVMPIGRRHAGDDNHAAFFWSLKPDTQGNGLDDGLDAWKYQVMELWPETISLLSQIRSPGQLHLARYRHHTARPVRDRPLVRVGDAAHSTSPQLGQGVNMALLDACALASAMQSETDIPSALTSYHRQRRLHVALYQAASTAFTPFYQSDFRILPWIRDTIVPPLAQMRISRRLLATLVSGTLGLPRTQQHRQQTGRSGS
ncbi:FAD-dependent oxidoreductase [Bosea sp. RAC05]|uniref:FAD-dependent oxidoreductase n=1 Tax=Bosea sp. RAC05 TaxID=1842539 RepID=UPI00083DF5A5|nr:NAD(P)/FAD-dependent oxidoreductase [Bosea sp. RAC05]